MAVYNGAEYLRECIDSVLAQTFSDFEFVIVDDGSTDNSREILNSYADPRLRIIANDGNLGLTKSLNVGLAAARGDYIARIDAGDLCMPERLALQVVFLDAHPDFVAVGSGHLIIDAKGRKTGASMKPLSDQELKFVILYFTPFCHPAAMFRRQLGGNPVLYDESLSIAQDYGLWSKLFDQGAIGNLPHCLVCIRDDPEGITSRRRLQQIAAHDIISRRLIQERFGADLPVSGLDAFYRLLQTNDNLSRSEMGQAANMLFELAELHSALMEMNSRSFKAIAAEQLFNQTLRKRGVLKGSGNFWAAVVSTRGSLTLFLAMRLPSMIRRMWLCRRAERPHYVA